MKYSGIGGQAVIEGVMMKNKDMYAVAVRKPDGDIEVRKQKCRNLRGKYKIANVPIIRGIIAFAESLALGMNTLNYSASFYEEEAGAESVGETGQAEETVGTKPGEMRDTKEKQGKKESFLMGLMVVVAVIVAIGIFVAGPFLVSESLRKLIRSPQLRGLLEGVIRVLLFVIYVKLISRMEDIKRVFMYHGAEHKSINCIECGCELTVDNVRKQPTQHKRCGTSFLLIVMLVSVLFFMFIVVGQMWLRMVLRVLLIPLIAGLAYEFIHYAGSHDNIISNAFSKPGLWLQGLTTAEPDDSMIEVAIQSVDAVFDWRAFVAGAAGEKPEGAEAKAEDPVPAEKETGDVTEVPVPAGKETGDVTEVSVPAEKERGDATEVSVPAEKERGDATEVPVQAGKETGDATEVPASAEMAATAASRAIAEDKGIEIFSVDGDDEDDEILSALDRYFEAPK